MTIPTDELNAFRDALAAMLRTHAYTGFKFVFLGDGTSTGKIVATNTSVPRAVYYHYGNPPKQGVATLKAGSAIVYADGATWDNAPVLLSKLPAGGGYQGDYITDFGGQDGAAAQGGATYLEKILLSISTLVTQVNNGQMSIPDKKFLDRMRAVVLNITGTYTALISNEFIGADTRTGSVTINLPAASTLYVGARIVLSDQYSACNPNQIIFNCFAGDTIGYLGSTAGAIQHSGSAITLEVIDATAGVGHWKAFSSYNIWGMSAAIQNIDAGTHKIVNVTNPTAAQDAATKAYVDAATGGGGGSAQTANFVFAGPTSGIPAIPTWRALVSADLTSALTAPPIIGGTTPAYASFANADLTKSGSLAFLTIKGYYNSSGGTDPITQIDLAAARGTSGSPAVLNSGDLIGRIRFAPYGSGGVFNPGAVILSTTTQASSGTQSGSALQFQTTPNGTIVPVTALTIDQDGSVTLKQTAATVNFSLSANAGQYKEINFQTAGSQRWVIVSTNAAESGSNVGSDFNIIRYDDSGTGIDTPFSIKRSTGIITAPNMVDTGGLRATGFTALASGSGVEVVYTGGAGYVQAYDRSGAVYLPLNINASTLNSQVKDAGTTNYQLGLTILHATTGTPAVGFGAAVELQAHSSTNVARTLSRMGSNWVVATDASRTPQWFLQLFDTVATTGTIALIAGTDGAGNSKIGFLGAGGSARQTSGANLTNNVTSGGTTDTIADFTSLTVYATDAAAIRNDIYQLARKLKQVNDALRLYGLLT